MLSIEEIKLLIEKLEKVKKQDLQELIDSNLKILKDIQLAVDANNKEILDRLDKTPDWFMIDLKDKLHKPVDAMLKSSVQKKYLTLLNQMFITALRSDLVMECFRWTLDHGD